jgi:DNA repair protein RecO (recombination protein O)
LTQKDRIIVLKTFKHGESDLIVHGLNSLGARMGFFARGALRSRKRFAGGILEPTHYIEVTYKVSASTDSDPLHSLLEAQMIREFAGLRRDYHRLEMGLYFLSLAHKLGQQGVIDSPELFNSLGNALGAAEVSADLTKLKVHFELKLLAGQGVLPPESEFRSWLLLPLARHEEIPGRSSEQQLVEARVHDHLHQYLGMS